MAHTKLTSAEIGGLWSTYMNSSMEWCLITYFLHHIKDSEIKAILEQALGYSNKRLNSLKELFSSENIPIPEGFTEKDLNLKAPPLFYDPFALTFVYSLSKMDLILYSFITTNICRLDLQEFFTITVKENTELYKSSTTLLLSKGLYDRPPKIPYPSEVEYVKKESYINGFIGKKRPLNVVEITEIFSNIERNYFAILLCTGLLQVIKDPEIKEYLKNGKEISEKQINLFNDMLKKEDLLGIVPVNMEVTDSTDSPFSNKLVMALFSALNAIDVTLIGHALSLSFRTDLSAHYSKLIGEILLYNKKGFDILVDRKWLEKPPSAPDRGKLQNSK
ncbi:DUF3231 family protein [Heyndrickxia camelliae]|uniref:Sugar isomerase n=1 Tax=Heyndrickxia camelliae TaxID=1707093 RepID=A0A2N3LHY4_9BACI|nr:DUF3231 family protein [Heyndrickxia camelliae]PKR84143.1 sugar isomerase [Heyndrickxia camelliae]